MVVRGALVFSEWEDMAMARKRYVLLSNLSEIDLGTGKSQVGSFLRIALYSIFLSSALARWVILFR